MKEFKKVVACVIRKLETNPEILAFIHPPPLEDFQIPKGTVEDDEDLDIAVLRELKEESGLDKVNIISRLDPYEIIVPGGPHGDQDDEIQRWFPYILSTSLDLPEKWQHMVEGDGVDQGMVYNFFWHPLMINSPRFHAKFLKLFDMLRIYLIKNA